MQIELADNLQLADDSAEYIYVPSDDGGVYLNECAFDVLSDNDWSATMDLLEPYQPGVSGFFSKLKDKIQQKRQLRLTKKSDKNRRKNIGAESRGVARVNRSTRPSAIGSVLRDVAGSFLPGLQRPEIQTVPGSVPTPASPDINPDQNPNYKPLIIGGVAVLLIAGTIMVLKNKRK
jgi:hypothetical protein